MLRKRSEAEFAVPVGFYEARDERNKKFRIKKQPPNHTITRTNENIF